MTSAATYPATTRTLSDGRTIDLRLMTPADAGVILAFAATLNDEDVLFLRSDITQPEGVAYWVANVENGTTTTVLATMDGAVVGYASVHRNPARWTRHVGEVRVNVTPALRQLGLGRLLTGEIFDLARTMTIRKLSAQMTIEQAAARAAFRKLGFQVEAVLADWVTDKEGQPHDLLLMTYDVRGLTDTAEDAAQL